MSSSSSEPAVGAGAASQPREILEVWFGAPGAPDAGQPRDWWFKASDEVDARLRARFGALHAAAERGECDAWAEAGPHAALALVIVFDQLSRNLHRGTPAAFACDARALAVTQGMLARQDDTPLAPLERWFAYMPLEHSEVVAVQEESLRRFRELADDAGLTEERRYAERHAEIVRRFGRFPHRNAILGRVSTEAEVEFLAQPGSAF